MWFLLLLYIAHIGPGVLQGNTNRLILKNGSNPCEGHIEIYHNGTWGYVGVTEWNRTTEEVVCRSTHCGKSVSSEFILRPIGSTVWLSDIKCYGNESHLWDCVYPGWGVSIYRQDDMKKIKCTKEIKISLDGFDCAGAVRYSTGGDTPSGYFCADNWGPNEADLLCRSLGCGTSQEIPQNNLMVWKDFESSEKMTIACSGIENLDNLWQCATTRGSSSCSKPASVMCSGHEIMQLEGNATNACEGQLTVEKDGKWTPLNKSHTISPDAWCQQMYCGTSASHRLDDNGLQLNCIDNVTVTLMDKNKPSKCYGAVYVLVNTSSHPVCASIWTNAEAELVCRELKCGKAISKDRKSSIIHNGIMDHVNCSGKESSLWHCRAKRGNRPLSCTSQAYVVCADSIDVRLVDSPGGCAGRVEVQYEGQWWRVGKEGWTNTNSDIVCRQLKCGNRRSSPKPDIFSHGSGGFLSKAVRCPSKASHISECVEDFSKTPSEKKSVAITCEEHNVLLLKGNHSCSGLVGIEQGRKTFFLSGSNKTWNQECANAVCRQMHCGEALSTTSCSLATGKDIWKKSYHCSSNTTYLFDCENTTLPSDHNETIASVECSGNISMNLTNKCWGNVNVCVGGDCGGVCRDTWTDQKSSMLCANLDCGIAVNANRPPEISDVIIKSLHLTSQTSYLNQSILVLNVQKDTRCNQNPAYVVCSGSFKTRINRNYTSRYKCSGNVEMYYEGRWLPVCKEALRDIETQKAICGEEKCGQAVRTVEHFGPKTAGLFAVSQVQCPVNTKSLKACNMTSDKRSCTLGGLRCSSWRKMELKFDKKACSGALFVHSEGSTDAVSIEGWTEAESDRLCQDLKCGNYKSNTTTIFNSVWNRSFSCEAVEDPKNIWACEKPGLTSLKQQLNIECQEEPRITLSEECTGEVRINDISVCSSHWDMAYSDLVCQEKGCIKAIFTDFNQPDPDVKYHHVSCEDYHQKLGQCNRYKAKCEGRLVSVYCAGSVDIRTTEKCGGRIEVKYGNKWGNVCLLAFPPEQKENMCRYIRCPGHNASLATPKETELVSLETTLDCTADLNIALCVRKRSCGLVRPAEIYCNGYITTTTPSGYKLLGVGLVPALVFMFLVFICIKKGKKPIKLRSNMSIEEMEFTGCNRDEVISRGNDKDDLSHHKFMSEAEVIMEAEARSASSYDDVDEALEAQPQTSQTATAAASREKYFIEGGPDQSSDGSIYETGEPDGSYDDIDSYPQITQTKAEIHNIRQNAPANMAAVPPGLMPGIED